MKYSHMVKKNGVYYEAGEEVPEVKPTAQKPVEDKPKTSTRGAKKAKE